MPHPTTLMKPTTRCGTMAVDRCNEALLAKAAQAKLLRTERVRADTIVVAANVVYPTDSGLLAKAVRRIAAAGRRVQAPGGATRTRLRDRSRSTGRRAREIGSKLRLRGAQAKDEAQTAVRRITGELAGLAEQAAGEAEAETLLANARRAPRPCAHHGRSACRGRAAGPRRRAALRLAAPGGQRPDRAAYRNPDRSPPRPASGCPAQLRTAPPGRSACMTVTPALSPRAASASRSSSAIRPRSAPLV